MKEKLKAVPGMDGRYFVSNTGRVYSAFLGRDLSRKLNRNGYYRVFLKIEGRRVRKSIHRLVALAFLGPAPPGYVVNHIDGNKHNNSADNLEYLTRKQNIEHAMRLGLHGAKLTRQKVSEIRSLRGKATQTEIAVRFGVSKSAISQIFLGQTWAWCA